MTGIITAVIAVAAIIAVIAAASCGAAQGEHLAYKGRDEGYGLVCTYTFAWSAMAIMLIVVLAVR